jgi:hypothetical protein
VDGVSPRPGRYVETEEYLRFLHRILGALANRVGDADVEMLKGLADLGGMVGGLLAETVDRLRTEHGYTWADVGRALGITRQSAHERFRRQADPDSETSVVGGGTE